MRIKNWTTEDLDLLREKYSLLQREELIKIFVDRSFDSIRKKAKRLGYKKSESFCKLNKSSQTLLKNIRTYYDEYLGGKTEAEIAKETGTCSATVAKLFSMADLKKKDKSNVNRKYTLNEGFFNNIDTEAKAYYLGFIFADGFVSKKDSNFLLGIEIHSDDIAILQGFKASIASFSPIKVVKTEKRNSAKIRLYSKKLVEQLISKGCVENKSLVLNFPSADVIPANLLHHFIRGYFDGDGSIKRRQKSHRHVQVEIVSSHSFISTLIGVLHSVAGMNIVKAYSHGNYGSVTYCGRGNTRRLFNFFYKDATIFLKRKYDRFIEYLSLSLPKENRDLSP